MFSRELPGQRIDIPRLARPRRTAVGVAVGLLVGAWAELAQGYFQHIGRLTLILTQMTPTFTGVEPPSQYDPGLHGVPGDGTLPRPLRGNAVQEGPRTSIPQW